MPSNVSSYRFSFYGLSFLFFMWGFITVMNDVLINSFETTFGLSPSKLSYIQLAFFGTFFLVSLLYFLISSISGKDPINRLGYKKGMALSLFVCSIGCGIAFIAGLNGVYMQFILALFVISIGVTLLQICANPYATLLGPESLASSRLNVAQGLNSLGTTVGPIVGNILIYSVFSNGEKDAEAFGFTYLTYGIVFLLMAGIVAASNFPAFVNKQVASKGFSIFSNRNLSFGILAIFFYVGAEVAIGSWIGKFSREAHIMNFDEQSANYFLSFFWGGLMIGRLMAGVSLNHEISKSRKNIQLLFTAFAVFFLIWIVTAIHFVPTDAGLDFQFLPKGIDDLILYLLLIVVLYIAFIAGKGIPQRLIVIFSVINVILLTIAITTKGAVAFWALLGTGLFLSVGWSNIFSLSLKGLGDQKGLGSSLLVMAIVGGAVLPMIQSHLIEAFSVQLSFLIPLIAMLYLIFYGLNGYRQ
ncbi:MAG: MFS transporter [Crocinitomicaceae bacterium]